MVTGAALGTLLVLAMPAVQAAGGPEPRNSVSKCLIDGVATYSDRPCPEGSAVRRIALDDASHISVIASVVPARTAIRDARCEAAEAELRNIAALTQQGQPVDMQAFLDARRQHRRNEQFRYGC